MVQSRPRSSSGLVEVVGDDPAWADWRAPAHGHVRQFAAAAVGEEVGGSTVAPWARCTVAA